MKEREEYRDSGVFLKTWKLIFNHIIFSETIYYKDEENRVARRRRSNIFFNVDIQHQSDHGKGR